MKNRRKVLIRNVFQVVTDDVFSRLIVNNTLSSDFQYIRDVAYTATPPLWGKAFPIYNVSSPDQVCGRSAFPIINPSIETATIIAGSEAGFHLSGPFYEGDTQAYIYHPGPGQVFLSALPDGLEDLSKYDGKGDWFKIAYAGPKNDTTFRLEGELEMRFLVPTKTPPGKYLMRMEQFLPHREIGQTQWFVNCAHINIVGEGGGTPGPFIRFPDGYKDEDPSLWFRDPETGGAPKNISGYVMPEPAVWDGA
ncbi:hypothetical protein N0V90_011413 [Kalmusia sp. IMI 367209]|nr:hypothetical protein N0V90_011413 [Kalmusia sp. IMI 367209]